MPTTLPLRIVDPYLDDGLAGFGRALLRLYGVLALALLSLSAIEMHFGMYPGSTVTEAILRASGMVPFAGATF